MSFRSFVVVFLFIVTQFNFSRSDIYLHNPRGSNNRHNENTRERAKDTLSFDSQNNDRGGYNVGDDGRIYYYTGSILPVQWTNQHSCNDVNTDCTILLQYTCNDNLRDGQTTERIPISTAGESDVKYRLTEDLTSYLNCRVRSRNRNLFTADQNLGNAATSTRQNPGGQQYGYECPEERDYYPYWQPTNWIDIAVLTNREDLCPYFRSNSENVRSRFACTFDKKDDLIRLNGTGRNLPLTQTECENFNTTGLNVDKPRWREYPSHNLPAPDCYSPSYTRENHLGDVKHSEMATFNWTIPTTSSTKCLLRIRYNISTGDYDGWNTDAQSNRENRYILNNFFPNETIAKQRGFRFKNNPEIKLFDDLDLTFQLAVNTAQYGRVFEDRSFVFEVRSAPAEYQNRPIYNLNVRGRRGNIVQVYPAVEYDFVPNRLEMQRNSYVHIQWIGSNTTPDGAGQGTPNIDRNNLLLLVDQKINTNWNQFAYLNSTGLLTANQPALINQSTFLNLPREDLRRLAASGINTDPQLLNASAYFDLGTRLISTDSIGVFHYVSTRNNDFSNRDQKGRIIVQPFQFKYFLLGYESQTIQLDDATVIFPAENGRITTSMKLIKMNSQQLPKILPINGQNVVAKEKLYDDVFVIEPYDFRFPSNIEFQLPVKSYNNDAKSVSVLQFQPANGVYMKVPVAEISNGRISIKSDTAGVYVFVKSEKSPIWIAGVVIPIALVLIIVISTIVYFRLSPSRYTRVKDQITRTKRSFFSRI